MEGKELHEDDDDKRKKDSSENNDSFEDNDSDDFGLPEIEDADSSYSDSDKEEDSYDSDDYSYSSSADDDTSDYEDQNYYASDEEENEDYTNLEGSEQKEYYVHGLNEEEKSGSKAGIVILIILLVLAAAAAIYWFLIRTPEPVIVEPKPQPKVIQKDTIPEKEPEPIIQDKPEPSTTVPGEVTQLSQPTGRYYVIVASFIDDDLAMDYGKKLSKQGVGSTILTPKTEKGFYRLALADFASLKDATLKSEQLKSTYGSDVWVIKY